MLYFRLANTCDVELYFTWLNDRVVRTQSFNSKYVEFSNHKKWFENKLKDENCLMLIFYTENNIIGQVRIEKEDNQYAVIGISIGSSFRGKGFSTNMLRLALDYFFKSNPNFVINAFIKKQNLNSIFSFENVGFEFNNITIQKKISCLHYRLKYENWKL